MNRPNFNTYAEQYGMQQKALVDYINDLEKYCTELEIINGTFGRLASNITKNDGDIFVGGKKMTKADIMYNFYKVDFYTLRTDTTMNEDNEVCTCYYVDWHCCHGDLSHFEQEISKDEYEYLLKEMDGATNRLTDRIKDYYFSKDKITSDHNNELLKLGQLEDVEEELGIDLVTLFKALKNGIWSTEFYMCESPRCKKKIDFIIPNLQWHSDGNKNTHWSLDCGDGGYYTVEFEDYGKTWALTKEELEK